VHRHFWREVCLNSGLLMGWKFPKYPGYGSTWATDGQRFWVEIRLSCESPGQEERWCSIASLGEGLKVDILWEDWDQAGVVWQGLRTLGKLFICFFIFQILSTFLSVLVSFFGDTRVCTQGFTLARQVLYLLSHSTSPSQNTWIQISPKGFFLQVHFCC
jgi:hypothetical protein